jgi:hypothetical protein
MSLAAVLARVSHRRPSSPYLALAALWTVAAWPWLLGIRTIPFDAKEEFYPGAVFAATSWLRGEAPLWNPYQFAGYPAYADPQAMTFSPTVALPMLLAQSMRWFDTVVLLHVLAGGMGMLRLGRSYRLADGASVVSALVFMFAGVASARLQHTPMIITWSFLPWILVAIRATFRRPSWRATLGLGVAFGLASLQLTQVLYLGLLLAGAYATYRLAAVARFDGGKRAIVIAMHLAAAATVGLLIALPQIVATLTVLPSSTRGGFDYASATVRSLSPLAYTTLLSPNALGNLSANYAGPNDVTETYHYLGAFPLVLLVSAIFGRRAATGHGEAWFWKLALAASVLYALGGATPAFAWLFEHLPGLAYFRRPTDAAFVFVFCAAVLVGMALDADRRANGAAEIRGRPSARAIGLTAVALAVAAIAVCVAMAARPAPASLLLLGAGAYFHARGRSSARSGIWIGALVISIFIDLRIYNVANRLNALRADKSLSAMAMAPGNVVEDLGRRLREDGPYRVELRTRTTEANAPQLAGVASIGGLNPLLLKDYVTFLERDTTDAKARDLLGVRYLVTNLDSTGSAADRPAEGYRMVGRFQEYAVWQNPNAMSRVQRPRRAVAAPPLPEWTTSSLDAIDIRDEAYVDAPDSVLTDCGGGRAERAEIARESNNEVVLSVDTRTAAWIVLSDVYFRGWRAEVSGVPAPIYRANGIFRAVCVPQGTHVVRFTFEPFRRLVDGLSPRRS